MVEKLFVSSQQLLEDSFKLGLKVYNSGFKPDFIVGIWRGGTPVGIVVQELLDYFGIKTDHISIRTSSYEGIEKRKKRIRVHGFDYIIENINHENSLLIVDDVFDTGLSIEAIIKKLKLKARRNAPHDTRVATVYYKPDNRKADSPPDYFMYETDKWLIFPHELDGLTGEEIREFKPSIAKIIGEIK